MYTLMAEQHEKQSGKIIRLILLFNLRNKYLFWFLWLSKSQCCKKFVSCRDDFTVKVSGSLVHINAANNDEVCTAMVYAPVTLKLSGF